MNAPFDANRVADDAVRSALQEASAIPPAPVDLAVLNQHRRPPPVVPLEVMGPEWSAWVAEATDAATEPADYVFVTLLATASALIGNARWSQATPGWAEPPHLWCGIVGDAGSSKSPGTDAVLGCVLLTIERRLAADFPEREHEYLARVAAANARRDLWTREVRTAARNSNAPPPPPVEADVGPAPVQPLVKVQDATIERVGTLIGLAMPKGILVFRDELAGWLAGMNTYNENGRAFWLESYGGRPYRIDRQKAGGSITIPRLAAACLGGTQPEKLAETMRGADDGLLARFCWAWPKPIPFTLAETPPRIAWAIEALDKLRPLDMTTAPEADGGVEPVMVPLDEQARSYMHEFGRRMQERQQDAGGLRRSAFCKARGLALRLSLVSNFFAGARVRAIGRLRRSLQRVLLPTRCTWWSPTSCQWRREFCGDAGARGVDRDAATLARWTARERPVEVHVRRMQREVRLPGLTDARSVHDAAKALIEAGWLTLPASGGFQQRGRLAYPVNPALWEVLEAGTQ